MIDYNKRLTEVDIILNHLEKSDYEKIPKEIIQAIDKNKDTEYVWNYDETKELKEQNVSRDTIAILSYLNMQFLLNEEQRKFIQQVHSKNEQKLEHLKKEKYNPNNLFEKKENLNIKKENLPIEVKKESFFRGLIMKIKNFLRF